MILTDKTYKWQGKLVTGLTGFSQFVNDIHRARDYFGDEVEIKVKVIKRKVKNEKEVK